MMRRGEDGAGDLPRGGRAEELRTMLRSDAPASRRFLLLCDWILDLSTGPFGRVVVGICALTGAWYLL